MLTSHFCCLATEIILVVISLKPNFLMTIPRYKDMYYTDHAILATKNTNNIGNISYITKYE